LKTQWAKDLALAIQTTDQSDWWFTRPDESWWRKGNGKRRT